MISIGIIFKYTVINQYYIQLRHSNDSLDFYIVTGPKTLSVTTSFTEWYIIRIFLGMDIIRKIIFHPQSSGETQRYYTWNLKFLSLLRGF